MWLQVLIIYTRLQTQVLDSFVVNCGRAVRDELSSPAWMKILLNSFVTNLPKKHIRNAIQQMFSNWRGLVPDELLGQEARNVCKHMQSKNYVVPTAMEYSPAAVRVNYCVVVQCVYNVYTMCIIMCIIMCITLCTYKPPLDHYTLTFKTHRLLQLQQDNQPPRLSAGLTFMCWFMARSTKNPTTMLTKQPAPAQQCLAHTNHSHMPIVVHPLAHPLQRCVP